MTADSIRALLLPRCRSARPTGAVLLPSSPRHQPRTGGLLGVDCGVVASASELLAIYPRGVRSSPEALASSPEVLASTNELLASTSGLVGWGT